jgi:hypothetical protein
VTVRGCCMLFGWTIAGVFLGVFRHLESVCVRTCKNVKTPPMVLPLCLVIEFACCVLQMYLLSNLMKSRCMYHCSIAGIVNWE